MLAVMVDRRRVPEMLEIVRTHRFQDLGGLVDATTADEALTAGQPPTHAGWLSGGIDAAKVEQALAKLGAKRTAPRCGSR